MSVSKKLISRSERVFFFIHCFSVFHFASWFFVFVFLKSPFVRCAPSPKLFTWDLDWGEFTHLRQQSRLGCSAVAGRERAHSQSLCGGRGGTENPGRRPRRLPRGLVLLVRSSPTSFLRLQRKDSYILRSQVLLGKGRVETATRMLSSFTAKYH